jgi:hypothetical protein
MIILCCNEYGHWLGHCPSCKFSLIGVSVLLNQNVINIREEQEVAYGVFFTLHLMTDTCQFYENMRFIYLNMVENIEGIFVCCDIPEIRTFKQLRASRLTR